LARGRGVDSIASEAWRALPEKREGDRRSPAGLFAFGTAFGRQPATALGAARWPYRRTSARDFWVDDPEAPVYNTWQRLPSLDAPRSWSSAERLSLYDLALVIRHNDGPVLKGAGSAHFVHSSDLARPTSGCTGVERAHLWRLINWLDPERQPLLLQTAGYLFE
jgi:L,D-peptidoglycan transpeptidase YkuD (ErfK/YbiS/YcfS/YnhG family)